MINISSVLSLMKINGITNTADKNTVEELLNKLQYTESDKQEVFLMLKAQGWFPGATTEPLTTPPPFQNTITPEPAQIISTPQPNPEKKKHYLVFVFVIIVLILIGSFTTYAYVKKIGPFAVSEYTNENFLSDLMQKVSEIDSASYIVSSTVKVVPRDNDAKPFTLELSNTDELNKKYYYDSQRIKDAMAIIGTLNMDVGYNSYNYYQNSVKSKTPTQYPENLNSLFNKKSYSYYSNESIVDPATDTPYEYRRTDGNNNFELTINFDTDYAIDSIKKNRYFVSTTTIVSGKKVTFTKQSPTYVYMNSEPPKPFLMSMNQYMSMLPVDFNVFGSISIASKKVPNKIADWLFNLTAEGDLGDLTYKFNLDAIKKDDGYYLKINNMPSLYFFGDTGIAKGQWIKLSTEKSTTSPYRYSTLSYMGESIKEYEQNYKTRRDQLAKLLRKAISIADEEKLILFKSEPVLEKINEKELKRYELTLNKQSILPFYKRLQEEVTENPDYKSYKYFVDYGLINYLQSEEFDQVFDYVNKNNAFVLWIDKAGFPVLIQNTIRFIPTDEIVKFEGKQINLVLKITIDKINENPNIQAPDNFVTTEKLLADYNKPTNSVAIKSRAANIKANLSGIRASAEMAFDKGNSYGNKPYPLGPCKTTKDTLFEDNLVAKALEAATEKNISAGTCVSKGTTGKVTSYAVSVPLPDKKEFSWCIDSMGASKEILGAIKTDICR